MTKQQLYKVLCMEAYAVSGDVSFRRAAQTDAEAWYTGNKLTPEMDKDFAAAAAADARFARDEASFTFADQRAVLKARYWVGLPVEGSRAYVERRIAEGSATETQLAYLKTPSKLAGIWTTWLMPG